MKLGASSELEKNLLEWFQQMHALFLFIYFLIIFVMYIFLLFCKLDESRYLM
jgi:hypothetical protein